MLRNPKPVAYVAVLLIVVTLGALYSVREVSYLTKPTVNLDDTTSRLRRLRYELDQTGLVLTIHNPERDHKNFRGITLTWTAVDRGGRVDQWTSKPISLSDEIGPQQTLSIEVEPDAFLSDSGPYYVEVDAHYSDGNQVRVSTLTSRDYVPLTSSGDSK